jgi:hypothetical protein
MEPATTHTPRSPGRTRRVLLGGGLATMATGVLASRAEAAPTTTPWQLDGNTNVSTANYLGSRDVAPLMFKTAATDGAPVERMRVTPAGLVGIGLAIPTAKVDVNQPTGTTIRGSTDSDTDTDLAVHGAAQGGVGVLGQHTGTTGATPGVRGESSSTASAAFGVVGEVLPSDAGGSSAGVRGISKGVHGLGIGVWGSHVGAGSGVHGDSPDGSGVRGTSERAVAVQGDGNVGVGGTGIWGVAGAARAAGGCAVLGEGNPGVQGEYPATKGHAVYGEAFKATGVHGVGLVGVLGTVRVDSGTPRIGRTAVKGQQRDDGVGYAGVFLGPVQVTGNLSKPAGSFKIDHPLDPTGKYLSHSFVESPDMKNIYDGVVVLDSQGRAEVTMPDWFEALNMTFRYQLTCIGDHAFVYVADEINGNRFTIAGGTPGLKVSWQVTGTRQDAYARKHPILVEENKSAGEQGTHLYPDVYGKSAAHAALFVRPSPAAASITPMDGRTRR